MQEVFFVNLIYLNGLILGFNYMCRNHFELFDFKLILHDRDFVSFEIPPPMDEASLEDGITYQVMESLSDRMANKTSGCLVKPNREL